MTYTETLNEMMEYAGHFLKPGCDVEAICSDLLSRADDRDGFVHVEFPARWTVSGTPLPATFEYTA
jgi:hypothetical protein